MGQIKTVTLIALLTISGVATANDVRSPEETVLLAAKGAEQAELHYETSEGLSVSGKDSAGL